MSSSAEVMSSSSEPPAQATSSSPSIAIQAQIHVRFIVFSVVAVVRDQSPNQISNQLQSSSCSA